MSPAVVLQEEDLKRLHEGAIRDDPFISTALGPKAKIERMRAAALRLGSQGLKTSYDDHLLIIGDAAGHIDPLTGEGIHTAMLVRCVALCFQRDTIQAFHWPTVASWRLAEQTDMAHASVRVAVDGRYHPVLHVVEEA